MTAEGAECCAFHRQGTKGPGLRQGRAGFQLGPCPQQVNVAVPPGAQTAPFCEDTQMPCHRHTLGASGSHWALSEEKEQTLADLHIGFSFTFHTQAPALTSFLLPT